jgi:hypothetical protein
MPAVTYHPTLQHPRAGPRCTNLPWHVLTVIIPLRSDPSLAIVYATLIIRSSHCIVSGRLRSLASTPAAQECLSSEPSVCVILGSFTMPKAGQNPKKKTPFRIIWVVHGGGGRLGRGQAAKRQTDVE